MEIRPVQPDDQAALIAFFHRMPEADRTFFKEDVDDPDVVMSWARPGGARVIAVEDGEVLGIGRRRPAARLVESRRRGAARGRSRAPRARRRARAGAAGRARGDGDVAGEARRRRHRRAGVADRHVRALGFEPEALLVDHVRDRSGELRDLLVLANSVESQFASMSAAGIVDSL